MLYTYIILLQGEYRIIVNAVYQCPKSKDLPLKSYTYLSKKSSKITEIKGNWTLKIPFDDSLVVSVLNKLFSWSYRM